MHCFQFNVFKVLWKHWNTRAYAHASLVHTSHNLQKAICTGKKSSMPSVRHNTGQLLQHLKNEVPKRCKHQKKKKTDVYLYKFSRSCFSTIFLCFSFAYPILLTISPNPMAFLRVEVTFLSCLTCMLEDVWYKEYRSYIFKLLIFIISPLTR